MITSIERIGTEKDHDGWFLINKHVQIKLVGEDEHLNIKLQFNPEDITEEEAYELGEELITLSVSHAKAHQ